MSAARRYLAILAALAVLGGLNACVAPQTKTIAFQGDSKPAKGGLIVTLDMHFRSGVTEEGTTYPLETSTAAPFIHFQVAQVGTVLSYSLKVYPIEPGQSAICLISINGLIVDQHTAKFPKGAICSGPPV